MKLEFLKNLLSVPTCSEHEEMFAKYIMEWCKTCGIKCEKDGKGNLFLTKGAPSKEGFYPCCTSHIDTVHNDQKKNIDEGKLLDVKFEHGKLFCDGTGVGADCKTGVACCLQACKQLGSCKCVLYVQEELGCVGCKAANNEEFFKDVSWCLGFDSPELNRAAASCNGTPLYSDSFFKEFLEPICKKHGLTNFKHEPGTDLWLIRKMEIGKDKDGKALHLETLNIGSGGYNPHQKTEYAVFNDVCKAEATGIDLLKSIPCDKQWTSTIEEPKTQSWWGGSYEPFDWSAYYARQQKKNSQKKSKKSKSIYRNSSQANLPGFDETPDSSQYDDGFYVDDVWNDDGLDDEVDGEIAYTDIEDKKSSVPYSSTEPDIKTLKDWVSKRLGHVFM